MKWFKHFADMRFDPKIRRLIVKFKIEGYGIYNAILESIAYQLKSEKPIPDLEENAQDIAEIFDMDTLKVEEIIKYCVHEELFAINPLNGRIVCLKMLAHLDNTMSSNPEIMKILNNFKKLEETSIPLKQIRLDKHRVDKIKKEKEEKIKHGDFVSLTTEEHKKLITQFGESGTKERIENLNLYKGSKGVKYASDYLTILNWERKNAKSLPSTTPSNMAQSMGELSSFKKASELPNNDVSETERQEAKELLKKRMKR
jgi:hypothetical protein